MLRLAYERHLCSVELRRAALRRVEAFLGVPVDATQHAAPHLPIKQHAADVEGHVANWDDVRHRVAIMALNRHYFLDERQEAAFSRHVMSCPRVRFMVNRGCVSEIYIPTHDLQSLSVRPCRARAWFASPSTGHHAGTCRRRAGSSFPARSCTPCRSP